MAIAQDHLDAFSTCYQKAVDRLRHVSVLHLSLVTCRLTALHYPPQLIFGREFPADYVYYKVRKTVRYAHGMGS
jgi:hypothetical protein